MVRFYATPRSRRRAKIKAKVEGTTVCPRLSVFRSNKYIYAQLIDDKKGVTLAAASDTESPKSLEKLGVLGVAKKHPKTERASLVGQLIAQRALKRGVKKIVFDRSGYKYHGRVKALAQGAREEGLEF